MPKRLIRCVNEVKKKGGLSAKYAWPICIKSTGLKPHKVKGDGKGGNMAKKKSKKSKMKRYEVEVGYVPDPYGKIEYQDMIKNNFVPKYPIKKSNKFKVI